MEGENEEKVWEREATCTHDQVAMIGTLIEEEKRI